MKTTYFILRVHNKFLNASITKLYKTKCRFIEEMFERAVEHYKTTELYGLDEESINENYEFYYNYFTIEEIVKI
jgi:hypothetical protein